MALRWNCRCDGTEGHDVRRVRGEGGMAEYKALQWPRLSTHELTAGNLAEWFRRLAVVPTLEVQFLKPPGSIPAVDSTKIQIIDGRRGSWSQHHPLLHRPGRDPTRRYSWDNTSTLWASGGLWEIHLGDFLGVRMLGADKVVAVNSSLFFQVFLNFSLGCHQAEGTAP